LGCSIPLYEVGEPLLWRRDRSGRVPAWSYFKHGVAGNIGDPTYADLLLRESEFNIAACDRCGHRFPGIGIIVRGGIIREVRVFQEWLPACDVGVIEGDGQVTTKPEWDDHPMASGVDGGWCERLTEHPKLLQGES
jgi:hypothetical protein